MRTKFHEAYSFWELILKNNEFQKLCNTLGYMKAGFFLKNHKHANKVGHTSEFPFGIYSWTLKNLKNQNFEKMKKKKKKNAGDIILHMRTKNHNHMRYTSWDTEWGKKFFCHFGQFFALYSPTFLTTQKTKILKKWKKHLEIWPSIFCPLTSP